MLNDNPMVMDDYYPVPASERETPKPKLSELAAPKRKRGTLHDRDVWEENIRHNAAFYSCALKREGRREIFSELVSKSIDDVMQYALEHIEDCRSAFIYAVSAEGRSMICCTLKKGQKDFTYPKLTYY